MKKVVFGVVCTTTLCGLLAVQPVQAAPQLVTAKADEVSSVRENVYQQHEFVLTVEDRVGDPNLNETIQQFVDTYFEVYPRIVERFSAEGKIETSVILRIENFDGVAYANGNVITVNAEWIRSNPQDIALLTHELTHVAQGYPRYDEETVWLTEGIADYSRYLFGPNDESWSLPEVSEGQHYTDSYRVAARFLLWLEKHQRDTIVDDLHRRLQAGTYSPDDFAHFTGKTLDQLWDEYVQNPEL